MCIRRSWWGRHVTSQALVYPTQICVTVIITLNVPEVHLYLAQRVIMKFISRESLKSTNGLLRLEAYIPRTQKNLNIRLTREVHVMARINCENHRITSSMVKTSLMFGNFEPVV